MASVQSAVAQSTTSSGQIATAVVTENGAFASRSSPAAGKAAPGRGHCSDPGRYVGGQFSEWHRHDRVLISGDADRLLAMRHALRILAHVADELKQLGGFGRSDWKKLSEADFSAVTVTSHSVSVIISSASVTQAASVQSTTFQTNQGKAAARIASQLAQLASGAYLQRSAAVLDFSYPPPPAAAAPNRISLKEGGEVMSVRFSSTPNPAKGDDIVVAGPGSKVDTGAGNDVVSAGGGSTVSLGSGNDIAVGGKQSQISGGSGNDGISAGSGSEIDGGDGDDVIAAGFGAHVTGGAGDDVIAAQKGSQVDGGAGNDVIAVGRDSVVTDLAGDNTVAGGANVKITTGDGSDVIAAASGSVISSGGGDDVVVAGEGATVDAGSGNDLVQLAARATLIYSRNSGNDTLAGSYGDGGSIRFGEGLAADSVKAELIGKDLRLTFAGESGSITLKDYAGEAPELIFADNSQLDLKSVLAAAKPA